MVSNIPYYECHIMMIGSKDYIKPRIQLLKWKFSAINDIQTSGESIKCYASRQFDIRHPEEYILKKLYQVADTLEEQGIQVIRRKIEKVLFDDQRSSVQLSKCEGACPECNLDDMVEHGNPI